MMLHNVGCVCMYAHMIDLLCCAVLWCAVLYDAVWLPGM